MVEIIARTGSGVFSRDSSDRLRATGIEGCVALALTKLGTNQRALLHVHSGGLLDEGLAKEEYMAADKLINKYLGKFVGKRLPVAFLAYIPFRLDRKGEWQNPMASHLISVLNKRDILIRGGKTLK